jgi:DNA-binding transcriptional MerR regulator/methylmalonyl-CoA mutase cobalamin-binding subunit
MEETSALYSIKAVSQATGVSIETLRAWERRYQIVEPVREANGRRSYQPDDVIRLRKLREATQRGHPISRLARLDVAELDGILESTPSGHAAMSPPQSLGAQMLAAAEDYRPEECDRLLAMALALLPVSRVVSEVLSPVLIEVGERWHRGQLSIAQERIISSAVRRQLSSVLDTYSRIATGPIMVLTTPSGQRHELGILMCALLAASRNMRCHYLGADLPVDEIATYATRVQADVVALSVMVVDQHTPVLDEIDQLASLLPAHIELWGGGAALRGAGPDRVPPRLKLLRDLGEFEAEITLLAARGTH